MYLNSFDKYECCGCTACEQICKKGAITMQEDSEGFFYPVIDKDQCINCGLCEKVCAISNSRYDNSKNPQVFASYHCDANERTKSSSGGIFFAIAQWIISQEGVVYGAAFDENLQLSHIGVDNLKDLEKLRGSKYLQSKMDNTYKEVKEQLKLGRWVYFVGTGCQVAGLKAFLRKQYPTLVTSDLVCHGTPSQKLFNMHIEYLGKKVKGNILEYKFRDSKQWGNYERFRYKKESKIFEGLTGPFTLSPYIYSFEKLYTQRYSCYQCKFAQIPRQGDITLADYWGVKDFFPQIDAKNGVSLVLLNNEQGLNVWTQISGSLIYHKSHVEDGARYNNNLIRHTEEPEIRKDIYEKIQQLGYDRVAETIFKPTNYTQIKIKRTVTRTVIYKLAKRIFKR